MAISLPQVPFKMSTGVPDIWGSIAKGQQIPFNYENMIRAVLENQKAKKLMPFVEPTAKAELEKLQQANIWNPQIWQSEIGYRGAEADKIRYALSHPGYMGSEETKMIQALIDMGVIKPGQIQGGGQGSQGIQGGGAGTEGGGIPAGGTSEYGGNVPKSYVDQNIAANGGTYVPGWQPSPINPIPQSPQAQQPQQQGSASPIQTGNPLVDAMLNRKFASSAYTQRMTQAFDFVHAPVDQKSYMIAQLVGAGMDPSEALHRLTAGETVPQVLQSLGYDPNNPPAPDFMPTRGNVEQLKKRQVALAEINPISDFIREGIGPYSNTIKGTTKQITDALTGMNKSQQAKFIAAHGLVPELANLRLNLSQGSVGQEALNRMISDSLMNIKVLRPLVSNDVWMEAQKLMDEQLTNAFHKAEGVYQVGKNAPQKPSEKGKGKEEETSKKAAAKSEHGKGEKGGKENPKVTKDGVTYEKRNGTWYEV